ncbi:hypothetical protein V2W45_1445811, partial [Cenococcum geophilum]
MFTNTPPPLHAPQAAAGARTFIYASLSTRLSLRVSLRVSLYASLSTRLSLHVSLYASPFLY